MMRQRAPVDALALQKTVFKPVVLEVKTEEMSGSDVIMLQPFGEPRLEFVREQ